ncbi:MAG: hypothetical protein Q7W53_13050 [Pseudomonadota bacterium]|nr:hypothetical protein [Pseudomonadota bacterium]
MKRTLAFLILISPATLSFSQSFTPFVATLKESTPLNKTSDITTPEFLPCHPLTGATVKVIAQIPMAGIPQFLSRIEVQNGQCKGSLGWITTSRLVSGV